MQRKDVVVRNVDTELLKQQSKALAEVSEILERGGSLQRRLQWVDAIEGVQNLIAAILTEPHAT